MASYAKNVANRNVRHPVLWLLVSACSWEAQTCALTCLQLAIVFTEAPG